MSVSLTTFPERIRKAEIAILSLLHQSVLPERLVLVLAEDEWSGRTRLPRRLRREITRGRVEVLRIDESLRSYNKLIPTARRYPESTIITVDDDVIYNPDMLLRLLKRHNTWSSAIIGHKGRRITIDSGDLDPYVTWPLVESEHAGPGVMLLGVGGVLYPAAVHQMRMMCDALLARDLTPTNDDIWFWACAMTSHSTSICLGNNDSYRPLQFQGETRALSNVNWENGRNDRQMAAVISALEIDPLVHGGHP